MDGCITRLKSTLKPNPRADLMFSATCESPGPLMIEKVVDRRITMSMRSILYPKMMYIDFPSCGLSWEEAADVG